MKEAGAIGVIVLPPFVDKIGYSYPAPSNSQKRVIWCGSLFEDKGFNDFVELVKDWGIKVHILTNSNDIDPMGEILLKNGIRDFDIRCDLNLSEKTEFIQDSHYAINTSKKETFGLFARECAQIIPTYVPFPYPWHKGLMDGEEAQRLARFDVHTHNQIALNSWEKFGNAFE